MPLIRSKSRRALRKNIATEIRAGRPRKEAAAIAYSIQRKSGSRIKAAPAQKRKKRKLSPAQLAALAKGRAAMAAKRKGKAVSKKTHSKPAKAHRKARHRSSLTHRVKRDTVVRMAKRGRKRSRSLAVAGHRGVRRARHAARSVAHTAGQEKHRTGAFIVAAGLGVAKAKGYTIPHVETIGEAGSIALGAYAARKFAGIKSPWLDHLITAAGVIAIYEAASSGELPLLGKKKKTEGDDDVDGAYGVR